MNMNKNYEFIDKSLFEYDQIPEDKENLFINKTK